jgi:predicted PurR-regulated permease PerM
MSVVLMIVTILAVLLLVFVLVKYLNAIIDTLMSIGGDGKSYLAKLRLGLRAIETETGHLPTQVTQLNESLTNIADGLKVVDDQLDQSINAALKQKV